MTDVQAAAQAFYADQLQGNAEALDYLGSRGISADLARRLGLGYAEDPWRGLADELNRQGYPDEQLVRAGLGMVTSRGTVVDRFRRRIAFPVRDEDRRLLGFTGRAAPGSSDAAPRYLDTLDRGVKQRTLHGLGDGRHLLERGAVPVVVEGPLDRIATTLATQGQYVGLAAGGVGFGPGHVDTLSRVVDLRDRRVVLALDADEAGQRAALAAWAPLRAAGALPDVAVLPAGTDPAQLAVEAPQTLVDALQRAVPLEDRLVDRALARWPERERFLEHSVGALRDAAAVVVDLPAVRVARQVARISTVLHVAPSDVTAAVVNALEDGQPRARGRASPGLVLRAG